MENERLIMREIAKKDGSFKRAQHDTVAPMQDVPSVEQVMASYSEALFSMGIELQGLY